MHLLLLVLVLQFPNFNFFINTDIVINEAKAMAGTKLDLSLHNPRLYVLI